MNRVIIIVIKCNTWNSIISSFKSTIVVSIIVLWNLCYIILTVLNKRLTGIFLKEVNYTIFSWIAVWVNRKRITPWFESFISINIECDVVTVCLNCFVVVDWCYFNAILDCHISWNSNVSLICVCFSR